MKLYPLDDQQHATVIAALNYYHRGGQGEPCNRDDWMHDLATNGDTVISLDDDGINELIESLNFNGQTAPAATDPNWLAAFKAEFDAKLAAMSDEELKQSFADLGIDVVIRKSSLPSLADIVLPEDNKGTTQPPRDQVGPSSRGTTTYPGSAYGGKF